MTDKKDRPRRYCAGSRRSQHVLSPTANYFRRLLASDVEIALKGLTTMGSVTKSKRGFASMDPDKQRDIARMGGLALASS